MRIRGASSTGYWTRRANAGKCAASVSHRTFPQRLARAVALLVAPTMVGAALLGCQWLEKKKSGDKAAASASVSASVASAPASAPIASSPSASAAPSASAPEIADDEPADASIGAGDATADAPSDALSDADAHADADGGDAKTRDAGKASPGVKKLDDEVPVKGKRRITVGDANVHRAPKDGVMMLTLPKGTEVKLIAQYLDWYRVSFVDPQTGKKAQGWIYVTNFIGPRRKSCPETWTYHYDKDGGWCERECSKKNDCKGLKDYRCSGGSCYYDGE